ncbi:hypothetical protein [Weissella viridescens]|uniref:hypothetical protein n=1 Tax=Weissella viridescens TaxID=1629 RepID=UPI003AF2750B
MNKNVKIALGMVVVIVLAFGAFFIGTSYMEAKHKSEEVSSMKKASSEKEASEEKAKAKSKSESKKAAKASSEKQKSASESEAAASQQAADQSAANQQAVTASSAPTIGTQSSKAEKSSSEVTQGIIQGGTTVYEDLRPDETMEEYGKRKSEESEAGN